jgi:outer membrane receptor protein involved in Fe transport
MLKDVALGTCIKDSTAALNVFSDPETTPIDEGYRNLYGAQVRGGTDAVRYFASGDLENEVGVFKLPQFSRRRLDSLGVDIPAEWDRPNTLNKASFRANLNTAVSPSLDLGLQSSYIRVAQRLPQVDNNVNSFWYNGTMGPGWKGAGPGYTGRGSLNQEMKGYAFATPAEIFQAEVSYNVQRLIGGTNADWRPFAWMNNRMDVGVDLTNRIETSLCRFQQCAHFGTQRDGSARDARAMLRNITSNFTSTASWTALPWLNLKSTLGVQYVNYTELRNNAQGAQLPPGAETPGAGTIPSASSGTDLTRTLGVFFEEAAALNDRLFLTAAVRSDQNSAFGTNFQRVYYPKGSLSWIMSDEGFFPQIGWINELRVRGAIGSSGVQPGPNDALRTFQVITANIGGVDQSGLRSNQLGNPGLKPEKSTEWEAGIDTRLFGSRVNLDFTYYHKVSKDALINLTIAPSAGASSGSVRTNLGSVRNDGLEAQLNANLFSRPMLSWDVTVAASRNSNELVTLGKDLSGKDIPPIIGNTIRQIPGYPLNGYWQRPYTFEDVNGDGVIVPDEVTVDTGFVFLGYSQPRNEVSVSNTLDLLRRRLRVNALVDHKSGFRLLNSEQQFLCQQRTNGCRGLTMEGASLEEQARAIAQRYTPVLSQTGYIEEVSFWRIREVSATYVMADDLAERLLRARGASITFAGRNLAIFTDWTGADPEQNYGQGDTQQTLLTAGPPTYWTVRVNLRY